MFFYASAFRRRRHYVFGLSVRPSVRSLKYPLLTCTWVCWSTRPTVTVLRHVRPSVCLSVRPSGEVSGHLPENAWREWPEIFTCWYLDHLQNWLVYGHGLLIFLILALFWLRETGQIWGFRAFPGERMEKWPEILHADVSWPPSELISLWSRSVDFSNFGTILI